MNPCDERSMLLFIARGLPIQSDVHTIATNGITGCMALTTGFAQVFRRRPSVTGRRTTWKKSEIRVKSKKDLVNQQETTWNWNNSITWIIDFAIAIPLTGTTEPINNPVRIGVTITEDMVEQVVSRILNATSPFPRKLAQLESCAPETQHVSMKPAKKADGIRNNLAITTPSSGLSMYWAMYPIDSGTGLDLGTQHTTRRKMVSDLLYDLG